MSKDAVKNAADAHVDLIPKPYDELYRALGYEKFELLFNYFGGRYMYIPSMKNVLSDAVKSQMVEECRMRLGSHEQIGRKYGYTGRYLRKLLNAE